MEGVTSFPIQTMVKSKRKETKKNKTFPFRSFNFEADVGKVYLKKNVISFFLHINKRKN